MKFYSFYKLNLYSNKNDKNSLTFVVNNSHSLKFRKKLYKFLLKYLMKYIFYLNLDIKPKEEV